MPTKSAKKPKPPKVSPSARLRECSCAMGGDHAAGDPVIRRVKILGRKSKNRRVYTDECMDRAVALYEGKVVYFDHRPKAAVGQALPDRPFISKFGKYENVRREGDGLFADLRYNPGHLYAGTVLGWAENDPTAVGFSHDVTAKRHFDADGVMIVTEIVEVHSVDLVEDPATTQGLFESLNPEESPVDPLLNPAPAATDEVADAPQTLAQKIGELVAHIADDAKLDAGAKKAKLKAIMKLLDCGEDEAAVTPEEKVPVKEEADEKEFEKAEESVRKKGDPDALRILESRNRERAKNEAHELRESARRNEAAARKMCADAKLPEKAITETFVAVLTEARDDAARASLIADRKSVLGTAKAPTSQGQTKVADGKLTVDALLA